MIKALIWAINIAFDAICHDIWNIYSAQTISYRHYFIHIRIRNCIDRHRLTLCIGSAYYYGISNNQYKDGYKKGFHAGVEYVIEFAKQKKNEE